MKRGHSVYPVDKDILNMCLMEESTFFFNSTNLKGFTKETKDGPYRYIDRGGSVLAVCHLDFVCFCKPIYREDTVIAGQLDDRLGLYIILHHLQKYTDVPFDILLTDSEEIGKSTAKSFKSDKDYNWIFSFDRHGTDVVMYDYYEHKYDELLALYDLNLGISPSFSDISYLEHLGVKAFNIGTSYYNEHTKYSFADLEEMDLQVQKFADFLHANSDVKMNHTANVILYDDNFGYDWKESLVCKNCAEDCDFNYSFCPYCGSKIWSDSWNGVY